MFIVGETAVELMTLIFKNAAWSSLIAFAAGQTFQLNTFCAADPPAVPVFTAGDILEILSGNIFNDPVPSQKLANLLAIAAWYTFCECATVATPAAPAPPAYPATAPTINPPVAPPLASGGCLDVTQRIKSQDFQYGPAGGFVEIDISARFFLPRTLTVAAAFTGGPTTAYAFPATATSIRTISSGVTGATAAGDGHVFLNTYSAAGVKLQALTLNTIPANGGTNDQTAALSAGAVFGIMWADEFVTNTTTLEYTLEVIFSCTNAPAGTVQQPCCPPDATLLAQLQLIQNQLNSVLSGLPSSAHSFALGTVHAGLSGNGSFALVGAAIAVKVELTTIPGRLGRDAGEEVYYFDAGFIIPIAATYPYAGQPIVYSPQLMALPSLTDSIGYTIPADVVVTVTELLRGP